MEFKDGKTGTLLGAIKIMTNRNIRSRVGAPNFSL